MRTEQAELLVVGAGPAGLRAAIAAARAGVEVIVIDENARPGGQIFHQLPQEFIVKDQNRIGPEYLRAQALFSELSGLPIRFLSSSTVWSAFESKTLDVVDTHGVLRVVGEAIILATGAYDRPVPIPGWTLPGVLTVGGAQNLLKTQRLIAGRRILMAGTGPLQLVVASQLAKAGAELVAVSDPVATNSVLKHTWSMLKAWSITRDGARYRWNLLKKGVPWIAPSVLTRIDGISEVTSATIATVDDDWRPIAGTERTFDVDTVCVGYGLLPSIELARLFGCALVYDRQADAWLPSRDEEFQTSVPGVYAVGDGAGVAGAAVAAEEGTIAGLAAACRLHPSSTDDFEQAVAGPRRRLAQVASFRRAMDEVYHVRPALYERAAADTIVCRCEDVCLHHLRAAIDDGAQSLGQVKAWTRAGMGPCQGRMCSLPITHILAQRTGKPLDCVGIQSALVPARPVSVQALIQDFPFVAPIYEGPDH